MKKCDVIVLPIIQRCATKLILLSVESQPIFCPLDANLFSRTLHTVASPGKRQLAQCGGEPDTELSFEDDNIDGHNINLVCNICSRGLGTLFRRSVQSTRVNASIVPWIVSDLGANSLLRWN